MEENKATKAQVILAGITFGYFKPTTTEDYLKVAMSYGYNVTFRHAGSDQWEITLQKVGEQATFAYVGENESFPDTLKELLQYAQVPV